MLLALRSTLISFLDTLAFTRDARSLASTCHNMTLLLLHSVGLRSSTFNRSQPNILRSTCFSAMSAPSTQHRPVREFHFEIHSKTYWPCIPSIRPKGIILILISLRMTLDIILSGVTGGITTYTSVSWSLPDSDIVDQECIGHWEICEIHVLPVIGHSTIEDLESASITSNRESSRNEDEDQAVKANGSPARLMTHHSHRFFRNQPLPNINPRIRSNSTILQSPSLPSTSDPGNIPILPILRLGM
jgi:hypothetical protein